MQSAPVCHTANWLEGTRGAGGWWKSNEFAEYEQSRQFLPNGKNWSRTADLFQPLRTYLPVRQGKLVRDVIIAVGN